MAGAIAKLTDELQQVDEKNRYIAVIKNETFEMLCDMCNKSEAFEKIIAESDKTLNACLSEVVKVVVNNGISDIEAYRRAVKFYCPDADIAFDMRIILPEQENAAPKEPQNIINIFDII